MLKLLLPLLCLIALPALAQPNIVLILVDDMSLNLMADAGVGTMPNLARMQADGVTFDNHFVTASLCCPSRASIFTGRLPHNTKVRTNQAPDGGVEAWLANGNDAKSFAPALQSGGYRTAFMGKYLNGWNPNDPVPPGWNRWVSTNKGYVAFGYLLNDTSGAETATPTTVLSYPPEHFTDSVANRGKAWIILNRQPFFIELAPFSPHSPYVPATRHEGQFLDSVLPKTPAYDARLDAAAPAWLQIIPEMKNAAKAAAEENYVNRLQSMAAVDEMIGALRAKLENLGIADNTYVIFTSDNGYHMGEFSLRPGKQTPFDFDIHVPMVIVGPGIAPGSHSARITSHMDIYPTLLEWAGLPPSATVDGRSMFTGAPRTMAVIEHLGGPSDPNDPDYSDPKAGDPPTYTALRMATSMYVEYETGEVGYYDMAIDPYQLHNVAASLTAARLAELHAAVMANATCAGAVQCGAAQER